MRACDSGLWLLFSLGLLHGLSTCFSQSVTSFSDLLFLSSATGDVVVELASGDFSWSQHLEVPDAVTSLVIRGSRQRDANGRPSTRFVCDDSALPAAEALFTYQGLSLTIENVTFTGCQNRAVSMVFIANADARVSIVGSLFHNNSRTVDTATPDNDKPLCLYVGDNFVGSLDLTNTSFIANTWVKPVPAGRRRRRAAQEVGGIHAPPPAAQPSDNGFGTSADGYGGNYGGGRNGGYGGYGDDGSYGGYGGYGGASNGSPPPAEPEGDGGTPGDAAGDNKLRAWQTTVGIACGGGTDTTCSVTVTNCQFINNTGGLNSALCVLCKKTTVPKTVNVYQADVALTEAMICNVNVAVSLFTGNNLLDVDDLGNTIVELGGPHGTVLLAAEESYNIYDFDTSGNLGNGAHAGNVDIPTWKFSSNGVLAPDWSDLAVENVLAKAPPPIQIYANFTGCTFAGTQSGGAGVVVTAYAVGTLRPPQDMYNLEFSNPLTATAPNSYVVITNCSFSGHASGLPAAHFIAPRSLMISGSLFTNNTGALVAVAAENTTFIDTRVIGNTAYSVALDVLTHPPNDTASTVKIQPNFFIRNVSVVLDRVTHSGNGGRQTGSFAVIYLSKTFDYTNGESSDYLSVSVNIKNSTFSSNSCDSKDCKASERALHLFRAQYVQMNDTTFEDNAMGALALEIVGEFFASGLTFNNNSNPMVYTPGGQFSMGAAGLYAGTDDSASVGWHKPGHYLVEDSIFSDNWAAGPGAAVVVKGISSQYRRCVFRGNRAANGGAMYIESNDLYTHNCTFFNNTAAYSGGAINFNGFSDPYGNSGQALRILHTVFNNNTAAWYTPKFGTVTNTDTFYNLFGGGAMHVMNNQASLQISGCNFTGNTAMGNKGGALQLLTPKLGEVVTCRFEGNEAAAGGAIYVEKAPDTFVVARSEFIGNSVLRQVDDAARFALAIAGQGGAIYGLATLIDIRCTSRFEDNFAMQGGAVYASAQSSLYINGYSNLLSCPLQMYKDRAYLAGFINNVAVLGGAIYTDGSSMSVSSTPGERNRTWLYDGKQDLRDKVDSNEVMPLGVLFYGNRACGGGAIYAYSAWSLNMIGVALVANEARLSVELDNQLRQGLFAAFPASGGVGGGVAFIGQAASQVAIQQVDFINNSAIDGGAISLAGETLCRRVEGCYNFTMYQVTMAGNRALNGSGGAVYWLQKDILQIRSCDLDPKYPPVQVTEYIPDLLLRNATDIVQDGAVRIDTFSSTDYDQFNATYLETYRYITFNPSVQYNFSGVGKGNFSAAMAAAAIANLTLTPLQATNSAQYLTVNSTSPFITAYNRTMMVNVTMFNGTANNNTETVPVSTLLSMKPAEGRKLPTMHAFAEHSIPAESLACWHWRDNKADPSGHGDDIASSAFYIQANDIVDYYTSFEALPINATIYDFYGQACQGYATQPPVQVRLGGLRTEADGTLVNLEIQENMNKSGLTIAGRTVVMSENGLAVFQNTRLRAPEGPRVLELNATVTKPVRELASVRLLVYVRPCTIGEFLDPTTKDMCIGCPLGTYNMMPAATQCETCPDSTNCTAPDEGAMMLPDDGYWQSNLYSEQVLACPNPDSCTYDAREDALREIQAVTWWAVKWMQRNASQRASMNTLTDQKWKELLARRVMLGANVDVVKPVETMSDEEFVNAVYNLTYVYNQNYTTTLCAEGYMGTLCGACQPGWGLVDEASCIKCPAKSLNDLYYALATIFTIFTIGMTVLSSLEAQKTARDIRDHGLDVAEVQQHTERLHQLDPAGQGWHGQTSLNPVRDSVGPVDGSRPGSRAASITAGPSSGTQLPPTAEGPNGSKSPLRPGPVAEATETDGGAPAPGPPPASLPPAAHQAGGSATNGSGALNVGAVALLFDGQQADAHKPKPDIASAGSASSFRPDKSGCSATAGASGTQRQGSVQGGVNASGRLPSTKEAYSKYQGLTEYEIDELKRAEEEMREESLNRYAANQSTIMRIFISYIQVLALLRNVPIRYPDAYNNYLKLNNQATAYPGDIVTMDCSLPYFAAGGLPRSMLKVILSCASPLYILLGFAILTLFGDMAIYYKKRKSRAKLMKATKKRGKSGKGVPLGESVERPEPYAAAAITTTTSNNNNGFTAVNTFARTKTSGSATAAGGASSLPVANSFAPVGAQPVYGFNSGALFFGLVKDNYCPTGRDDPLRNYGAFLWDRYFSQVLVMMIVIFFVLYPDVVDNLLSIFSCADVDFDKDGNPLAVKMGLYNKQVWTVDYNVTCYEGQHFVLAMALGIPGIILFAAGWPSINAVLMSPLGRQLCGHKTRFTEDMTEYYLNDYKPNFIWWESLVMLRKLAIALATTFLGSRDTDTGLNLLICMSILVVAVSLQLWFRPYHHVETNALEAGSICVLLLTLYLSLYFLLDASVVSNSGAIAVSAVIIGVNVAMVAIFLYYVMRSHWHTYIKDMGFDAEVLHGMSRAQIHQHMSKAMDEALPSFVPESVKSVITRAATGTLAHTVALQKRFSSPASLTVGTSATTMGTHISGPLSPKSPSGANGSGSPNVGTVNSLGRPQQQGQPERVNTLGRGKEEAKPKPSINPIDRLKANK